MNLRSVVKFIVVSIFLIFTNHSYASQVIGNIDGVLNQSGNYSISGWACQTGNNTSISVHLYVGGPAGGDGTLVKSIVANAVSESAVANACANTGTRHRFKIPLSYSELNLHQNKKIYVHGISVLNTPNLLLNNSGTFTIPTPPLSKIVGNIDGVALEGNSYIIKGWACQSGNNQSVSVHLYTGGPAGGNGQMIKSVTANSASELAVANACSNTGRNHRFKIPLSYNDVKNLAQKSIYIYGISLPDYKTGNLQLGNSGTHNIPSTVNVSYFNANNTSNDITIPASLNVRVNQSINKGNIIVEGKLSCPYNGNYQINAENIVVRGTNGHIECGTASNPFTGNISFILKGKRNSVAGDNSLGGKSFVAMNGGTITLTGKPGKNGYAKLSRTTNQGDNNIRLNTAVQWQVGDTIAIAPGSFNSSTSDTAKITAISVDKKTISLDRGLTFKHWGQTETFNNGKGNSWTLDERAEVINLTRNIKIMSANDQYSNPTSSTAAPFGAHMMIMGTGSKGFIDNVEFTRVGQMGKMGRYPFHWHKKGNVNGQYLKNSSIHLSFNRCVTLHATNYALVQGNSCYDHYGHGYFLEDGYERKNRLIGNIGFKSKIVPAQYSLLHSETFTDQVTRFAPPATFWISNPDNDVSNNIAAGSEGTGFWMAFHDCRKIASEINQGITKTGCVPVNNIDTLKFDNNTAHSNIVGITHDGAPSGKLVNNPLNASDRKTVSTHYRSPTAPIFRNLRVHKNTATGIYYRGNKATYDNNVMADNGASAFFAYNQVVRNSAIIGLSNNHTLQDLNYIKYYNMRDKIVGVLVYDGPFTMDNVHFAKFSSSKLYQNGVEYTPTAFKVMGAAARYINQSSGLTFNPAPARRFDMNVKNGRTPPWRDNFSAVVKDIDGTLTGTNNSLLRPNVEFNNDQKCSTINDNPTLAGPGDTPTSLNCNYEISHLRLYTRKINGNSSYIVEANNLNLDVQRIEIIGSQKNYVGIHEETGLINKYLINKFSMITNGTNTYEYNVIKTDWNIQAAPNGIQAIDMIYTSEGVGHVSPVITINNLPSGCKVINNNGNNPGAALTDFSTKDALSNYSGPGYYRSNNSLFFKLKTNIVRDNRADGYYHISCF